MILQDFLTNGLDGNVILPDDLLWEDELKWVPSVSKPQYSLTGALVIETATKLAGRPISLTYPEEGMAWITREKVEALRALATPANRVLRLVLEYANDTRTFKVMFRHNETPIESEVVKGFPDHDSTAWYRVKIKLVEIV